MKKSIETYVYHYLFLRISMLISPIGVLAVTIFNRPEELGFLEFLFSPIFTQCLIFICLGFFLFFRMRFVESTQDGRIRVGSLVTDPANLSVVLDYPGLVFFRVLTPSGISPLYLGCFTGHCETFSFLNKVLDLVLFLFSKFWGFLAMLIPTIFIGKVLYEYLKNEDQMVWTAPERLNGPILATTLVSLFFVIGFLLFRFIVYVFEKPLKDEIGIFYFNKTGVIAEAREVLPKWFLLTVETPNKQLVTRLAFVSAPVGEGYFLGKKVNFHRKLQEESGKRFVNAPPASKK